MNNELYHYGVKGMRWGVRKKYQPVGRQGYRSATDYENSTNGYQNPNNKFFSRPQHITGSNSSGVYRRGGSLEDIVDDTFLAGPRKDDQGPGYDYGLLWLGREISPFWKKLLNGAKDSAMHTSVSSAKKSKKASRGGKFLNKIGVK